MDLERRAPARPVPEPFQQHAEAVLGAPITWFVVPMPAKTARRLPINLVAQPSRLRVAAASRRRQSHPAGHQVNPQARTPALPLGAGRAAATPVNLARMINADAQTMICPSCRQEMALAETRCPQCGRPMGERGLFFYAFWVALSLVVLSLIGCIFYTGFVVVNRML
jgi:hypothetical protein